MAGISRPEGRPLRGGWELRERAGNILWLADREARCNPATSHEELMNMDTNAEDQHRRREIERIARSNQYTRKKFVTGPSLLSLRPNEAGWVAEVPYDGGPYDSSKYRVEQFGWDHQHCFLCSVRIEHGDHWWAAARPDEVGLCEKCHAQLFGDQEASSKVQQKGKRAAQKRIRATKGAGKKQNKSTEARTKGGMGWKRGEKSGGK